MFRLWNLWESVYWDAEKGGTGGDTNPPSEGNDAPPAPEPPPSDATLKTESGDDKTVPYSRFQEVNNQLRELQQAQEQAKRDRLAEDGRLQELIDQLNPKAERLDALMQKAQESLETELESVPEQFHSLIPDLDALGKVQWIQNARAAGMFDGRKAPTTDAGSGSDTEGVEITPEQLAMARQFGMSANDYLKFAKSEGRPS